MSRRGLLIALFASLALNLFAVGAIVGAGVTGWRLHGGGRGGQPHAAAGLGGAGRALSPEHREEWRTLLRSQASTSGAQLRQARMLRRSAWMRFAHDPLDAPGILADLDRSRTLEGEGRAALDEQIVAFAARLPADERVRFADALLQPRPPARRDGG